MQVQCEVDIEGFPCKCSQSNCCNPQGRRVFNRKEVDMYRFVVFLQATLTGGYIPIFQVESGT